MVFSSITFLFYFLPLFLGVYYILPWKNIILLLASLIFYAWGEPAFVPLLLLSAILNYSVGCFISKYSKFKKSLLYLGIFANICMLGYFKYFKFLIELIQTFLPFKLASNFGEIALPLGISFFTFQGISYLIDIYRGDVNAQKSFLNFAMYKAMFPQLIAGPIVRYHDVAAQIDDRPTENNRIWFGIRLFIIGLMQKVLIANTVALSADHIFTLSLDQLSIGPAWAGIACYSIQIFYDFSGYSSMAIGIGHMIGFTYPQNFNQPYSARSVTEFWRRWHMSLSSWFRDYLYIPLGGNRAAPWRIYFNLSLVFILCGLWHGAAWTFVIWGAWHGALLVLERAWLRSWLEQMPRVFCHAYTLLAVMIGWVFFRAPDVPYALGFLKVMFGLSDSVTHLTPWNINFTSATWVALAIGVVLSVWRKPAIRQSSSSIPETTLQVMSVVIGFLLCTASLAAGTYNPFIYFRF